MLPDPLHPMVVHFPIVFAVLLPIVCIAALWAIRRGASPLKAWGVPVALAALLAGSSWLAVETGENQEERVEDVVGERALHGHEEAAEQFLVFSGVMLALTGAGLIRGRVGQGTRALATVASFALIGAGVQVGHSGGNLVYKHGAASAYANAAGQTGMNDEGGGAERDQGSDKEKDDDD